MKDQKQNVSSVRKEMLKAGIGQNLFVLNALKG